MRLLLAMTLFALLAACGKPSLGNACRQQWAVSCKRAFECNRAGAEAVWGTEGNCTTSNEQFCAAFDDWECDDLSAYNQCTSEIQRASCSTVGSVNCPSSSTSTCRPKGNGTRATCGNTDVSSSGNACTLALSGCSDGRSYVLSCSGNTCTCNDGSSTRNVSSGCSTKSAAISACGWNVQP